MLRKIFYPAFAALSLAATSAHAVVFTIEGDPSDRSIGLNESSQPVLLWNGDGSLVTADDNGEFNKDDQAGIAVFQLPDLAGEAIATASLRFTVTGGSHLASGGDGMPKSFDLYALRTNSSNAVVTGDYGFGANPGNGDLIQDDFYTFTVSQAFPGPETVNTDSAADTALASWLQDAYDGGAVAGDYAFFRVNFDTEAANGATMGSANNGNEAFRPQLTIETVPEPATYAALLGLATLAVVGMRRRRR